MKLHSMNSMKNQATKSVSGGILTQARVLGHRKLVFGGTVYKPIRDVFVMQVASSESPPPHPGTWSLLWESEAFPGAFPATSHASFRLSSNAPDYPIYLFMCFTMHQAETCRLVCQEGERLREQIYSTRT